MKVKGIVRVDGEVYQNTITAEGVKLIVESIVNCTPIHPTNLLVLTAMPNDVVGAEFEDYATTLTPSYYRKSSADPTAARTNSIVDTVETTFTISSLPSDATALALVFDGTHDYNSVVKLSGNEKIFSIVQLPDNPGNTLTWSIVFEIDES